MKKIKTILTIVILLLVQTSFSQVNKRYIFNNFRADATSVRLDVGSALDTCQVSLNLIAGADTMSFVNNLAPADSFGGLNGISFSVIANKAFFISGGTRKAVPTTGTLYNILGDNYTTLNLGRQLYTNVFFGNSPNPYYHMIDSSNVVFLFNAGLIHLTDTATGLFITKNGISAIYQSAGNCVYGMRASQNSYELRTSTFLVYSDTNYHLERRNDNLFQRKIDHHRVYTKFFNNESILDSNRYEIDINKTLVLSCREDSINQFSTVTVTDNQIRVHSNKVLDVTTAEFKPRLYSASTEPDIPTGTQAYWQDTDDNKVYIILDVADTQYKTELVHTP